MNEHPAFHESRLATGDGARLHVRCSPGGGETRGTVLFVHGMGEHSSRYLHVAGKLAAHGFRVCLFDLRGHGRSDGRRGYIESYGQLLEDLDRVAESCFEDETTRFIYAHSLGAQIAINYLADRPGPFTGLVAASPWLELAFEPSRLKLWLARAMRLLWPAFTQGTEIRPDRLSRDLEFLNSMPDMHLTHHRMSARMYFELTTGALRAREVAAKWTMPILLLQGERDPVTSVQATRAFFEKAVSADKTLLLYPDGLHETHNDLDRERVLQDVLAWLLARSGAATTSPVRASSDAASSSG